MSPLLDPPCPGRPRRAGALTAVAVAVAFALLPGAARAGDGGAGSPPASSASPSSAGSWPASIVDLAAHLGIQDGGRVKPVQTYATYLLLRMNHRRSVKDPGGETLPAMEWLLDAWLRPARARAYASFRIDNAEIVESLGLSLEGKRKADRWSYDELFPPGTEARARLSELARRYWKVEAKDRSPVEGGIVELEGSVRAFEDQIHLFDFARADVDVGASDALSALFGGAAKASGADVLGQAERLNALAGVEDPHGGVAGGDAAKPTPDQAAARAARQSLVRLAESAAALSIVPPIGPKDAEPQWWTPGHLVYRAAYGIPLATDQRAMLDALVSIGASGGDPTRVEAPLRSFAEGSERLAAGRGESDKLRLEVFLARLDPFYRAVWLYVLAFLVLAVSWLQRSRWVVGAAWAVLLGAVALHATGIVIRCVLRERPPISTLYETCVFISAVGAIAFLVAETISRRGIALAVAPVFGGLLLFIGNKFEALKGEDTMPQLQAVLDTNFWLATHVTAITIGYCGGLVAALVAHVHVLGRAVGLLRGNDDFYRLVGRMTYGLLCFGLVFSVVGTILGGIWANDSWGRFWGWDPKENGALMICLSQLAILHARMGGYLKPFGFSMATIAAGGVIAFSWWGVNLLGIGLHSYGFTSGILSGLLTFGAIEAFVLAAGALTIFLGRAYGGGGQAVGGGAAAVP
jgi:ABC-type transport system involved in cytochrome c biogenesis permease subunit